MEQHYKCKLRSPPPSVPPANGGSTDHDHTDETTSHLKPRNYSPDESTGEIHRRARESQRLAKEYCKIKQNPPRVAPRAPLVPVTLSFSRTPPPLKLDDDFRYNPLHDLESVFWLATYFIFTTTGYHQDEEQIRQQEYIKDRLLYDDFQHSCVMRLDDAFLYDISYLHPDLRELALSLEGLRSKLTARFRLAEKDCGSITSSVAAGLHENFTDILHTMASQVAIPALQQKRIREDEVSRCSESTRSERRPSKRARVEL